MSLLRRLQENAREFSSTNGCIGEVDMVLAQKDTQGKIGNADEDGVETFDECGANVATADSGNDAKLYSGKEIGCWGTDDDDESEVESRASVGMESEFDEDTESVPEEMRDED